MNDSILLISDGKYIDSSIFGGVQLCTHEYMKYLELAGYQILEFRVQPTISFAKRLKIKIGVDSYDHYNIDKYFREIVEIISSSTIKLVFFNQIDLSFWSIHLRPHVAADVKFIGLSHGNESADYLHDITRPGNATLLQMWKLGRLLVKENDLFSSFLDGIIVLSEQEAAINQWLGANQILYLPRLLSPNFLDWNPTEVMAGFVGTLDHRPNFLGITYLADELQKIGFKYKIRLIGGPTARGEELAGYNFVEYIGAIDDHQLLEQVKTWALFLNPVFWYARGSSTKLAQAINWGIPCLTTPAGRRGYDLNDDAIVTADNTPKTFSNAVVNALTDKEFLSTLKKATENNALDFNMQSYVFKLKAFLTHLKEH